MDEFEVASQAMQKLMECVEVAMDYEDSDVALICALPLAKMLELEKASYFSYEKPNFNYAMKLVKRATHFINKEKVIGWMEDGRKELNDIVKGWE